MPDNMTNATGFGNYDESSDIPYTGRGLALVPGGTSNVQTEKKRRRLLGKIYGNPPRDISDRNIRRFFDLERDLQSGGDSLPAKRFIKTSYINKIDKIYQKYQNACGKIFGYCEKKDLYWTGSGVLINPNTILTCSHVIISPTILDEGYTVRDVILRIDYPFGSSRLKVIKMNMALDIAVCRVDNVFSDNLIIPKLGNSDELTEGDPVVAIGSPEGIANVVTYGIVATKPRRLTYLSHPALFVDLLIAPGSSGGPVFSMSQEAIIGIARGSVGELHYVIPIDSIKEWLDSLNITYYREVS